jgi:SpoVK/Ycf46/Vps4 family AAA+-type ATPase
VRGLSPAFAEEFQACNAGRFIQMPSSEHLIRAMITFQDVRNQAAISGDTLLVLAAAKRESDYRLLLATSREFSVQLHNIENFASELVQVLELMQSSHGQSMSPIKHTTPVSDRGSSAVSLNSYEGKDMQEARQMANACRRNVEEDSTIPDLDQVKGVEEAKEALVAEVAWIKHYLPYAEKGEISIDNVLLYGPEGTGKTAMVYSFAKWSELPFFEVDFSAVLDQRVGMIEKYVLSCGLCYPPELPGLCWSSLADFT